MTTKSEDRDSGRIAPFRSLLPEPSERQVQTIRRKAEQVQNVDGLWLSIE